MRRGWRGERPRRRQGHRRAGEGVSPELSFRLRYGVRFPAAGDEDSPVAFEQVGQGGVVEDGGGGVSNVEEEVEEPGVAGLGLHEAGELGSIAERGEWSVEEPHDVSDDDLGGRAAKLVASFPSPPALHDPGVLEGQEDRLEELLGNSLAFGNLVGRDDP